MRLLVLFSQRARRKWIQCYHLARHKFLPVDFLSPSFAISVLFFQVPLQAIGLTATCKAAQANRGITGHYGFDIKYRPHYGKKFSTASHTGGMGRVTCYPTEAFCF